MKPIVYSDVRGIFFESFHESRLERIVGHKIRFLQDNHSESRKGVLRGLHYQAAPFEQAKLVRVTKGSVLDVVVDLREHLPTYGQHFKVQLSSSNRRILFIPRGMAHGFIALEENTVFTYKCDQYYEPEAERGIAYNDPYLKIDWEIPSSQIIMSEKDKNLPFLSNL